MTDLEITRLCAEAMGMEIYHQSVDGLYTRDDPRIKWGIYDPLHDDAQAMALVKKFHIAVGWNAPGWGAFRQDIKRWVNDADLNRAICECVALMQKAKVPA